MNLHPPEPECVSLPVNPGWKTRVVTVRRADGQVFVRVSGFVQQYPDAPADVTGFEWEPVHASDARIIGTLTASELASAQRKLIDAKQA